MEIKIKRAGYEKNQAILENISFSIQKGEILGLIGTNGAGKSTTIKTLMKTIPWMEGEICLPNKVAYIPEQPVYYEYLTFNEHIELLIEMNRLNIEKTNALCEKLVNLFGLQKVRGHYISSFSKGMKQKAMLIFAFIQEADLYIVDEPFIGLDAMSTVKLIKLLKEEQQKGRSIILCTHVIDTAEKICNRFVWIDGGKLLIEGTKSEIETTFNLKNMDLLEIMEKLVEEEG